MSCSKLLVFESGNEDVDELHDETNDMQRISVTQKNLKEFMREKSMCEVAPRATSWARKRRVA